jgi:type IV pilus assembly protein PilO
MAAAMDTYIRWPARRKFVLWLVVGALAVAAVYFAVFKPKREELAGLESQSSNLEGELRKKKAVAARLETVKGAVELLNKELTESLKQLPTTEEIPVLLKTVSTLGTESGLEYLLFKPGIPKPVGPAYFYAEVPVDMENTGTFHDIATFFDKVSRLDRIVTVEQLEAKVDKYDELGSPKLKVKYTATTFRYLPEEERPKADKGPAAAKGKRPAATEAGKP